MSSTDKNKILLQFRKIPGVGESIAGDFWDLGFRDLASISTSDPEELYERLCAYKGCHVDRCMLYVFRCAVYYTSGSDHDPELLKWWNWKD